MEHNEDLLKLSKERRSAQEIVMYADIAIGLPDMDERHVLRARENMRKGVYFSGECARATAEKLFKIIKDGSF